MSRGESTAWTRMAAERLLPAGQGAHLDGISWSRVMLQHALSCHDPANLAWLLARIGRRLAELAVVGRIEPCGEIEALDFLADMSLLLASLSDDSPRAVRWRTVLAGADDVPLDEWLITELRRWRTPRAEPGTPRRAVRAELAHAGREAQQQLSAGVHEAEARLLEGDAGDETEAHLIDEARAVLIGLGLAPQTATELLYVAAQARAPGARAGLVTWLQAHRPPAPVAAWASLRLAGVDLAEAHAILNESGYGLRPESVRRYAGQVSSKMGKVNDF